MNLIKIKEALTYQDTPVTIKIGDEEFTFNVHRTVPIDKTEEFADIAVAEVIRDGAYHFALVEPSIDFATVAIFTDIDMLTWNRAEVHALINTTDIMKVIDQHADPVYLYNLRNAARKKIEYYLELSKPQSNSEKAYETLASMLDKLNNIVDVLTEKIGSFNVSDEDIRELVGMATKLDSVDEDKIVQFVLDKED